MKKLGLCLAGRNGGYALRFYIPDPLPVLALLPVLKCEWTQLQSTSITELHDLRVSPT